MCITFEYLTEQALEGSLARGLLTAIAAGLAVWCPQLGLAQTVSFVPASHSTLQWTAVSGAASYGLRRGSFGNWFQTTCLQSERVALSATDGELPEPGAGFYYLVDPQTIDLDTGLLQATAPCGPRIFLDPAATGADTGRSWTDAYTSLAAAVAHPRADNQQGLEIWVHGPLSDNITLGLELADFEARTLRLLGGFAGTETDVAQRDPLGAPTAWNGMLTISGFPTSTTVDGFSFTGGASGVRLAPSCCANEKLLTINRSRFHLATADFRTLEGDLDLTLDGNRFDATPVLVESNSSVRAHLRLIGNHWLSGGLTTRTIQQGEVVTIVRTHLDLLGNRIEDAPRGVEIAGRLESTAGLELTVDGRIISNLIVGSTTEGIAVSSRLIYPLLPISPRRVVVAPMIWSNTIHGSGTDGIAVKADAFGVTVAGNQSLCTPTIGENLITASAGYAIREAVDNAALGISGDPVCLRNDLFGGGALYLNEGTVTLNSAGQVNALGDNRDNRSVDPRYVDASLRNFRLRTTSPAIDLGDESTIVWWLDQDGQPREADGNGDGRALPDLGAHEIVPSTP